MKKILTFLIVFILLAIDLNLVKGSFEANKKLTNIGQQEGKVRNLEEKNKDLKEELIKRNSSFYIETQARNLLNYSREGETTIIISDQALKDADKKTALKSNKSNLQQWLDLITN